MPRAAGEVKCVRHGTRCPLGGGTDVESVRRQASMWDTFSSAFSRAPVVETDPFRACAPTRPKYVRHGAGAKWVTA